MALEQLRGRQIGEIEIRIGVREEDDDEDVLLDTGIDDATLVKMAGL